MTNPLENPTANPFEIAREAAQLIAERTGVAKHDIALTLGSGWAKAADLIGETVASINAADIPGFSAPVVEGHVATIRSIALPNGKHALVLGARTHFYEGHGVRRVVHGVRTAAAAGACTRAAGERGAAAGRRRRLVQLACLARLALGRRHGFRRI